MSREPSPGERLEQWRREIAEEGFLPVPMGTRDTTFGPSIGRDMEETVIVGEIAPSTVDIGRLGSSLIGALAVAVTAARRRGDANDIFLDIWTRRVSNSAYPDTKKKSADTLQRVMHDFGSGQTLVPELATVAISPLLTDEQRGADVEPLHRVFDELQKGSAIILPVEMDASSTRKTKGKTTWGTIAGYREEVISVSEPTQPIRDTGNPEKNRFYTQAHFAVAIAFRSMRIVSTLTEQSLDEQLGDAEFVYVVSLIDHEGNPELLT